MAFFCTRNGVTDSLYIPEVSREEAIRQAKEGLPFAFWTREELLAFEKWVEEFRPIDADKPNGNALDYFFGELYSNCEGYAEEDVLLDIMPQGIEDDINRKWQNIAGKWAGKAKVLSFNQETITVEVPKDKIGAFIGKKGRTIKQIEASERKKIIIKEA